MQQRMLPSPTTSEFKWVQTPRDGNNNKNSAFIPYVLAKPIRPLPNNKVEYAVSLNNQQITLQIEHDKVYQSSNGALYDDMCQMAILNQPQVLNNLIKRYKQDQIFTYIGPTLIVVNPYKLIERFFSKQFMIGLRDKIMSDKAAKEPPHVYLIAGKAYKSMAFQQKKQAIVISGQSGAGKTQSTKYCMQLLTSLSHKQAHPIQAKILACNPLLQAFGNSKTIRNDNSSRFGKYVRIFFEQDNTIVGATINSYLLQKSRVTSISPNERSFHVFYCLTAAGIQNLKSPDKYKYLQQSQCYTTTHQDDKQYFYEISKSMDDIGFKKQQKEKIWKLVAAILLLGNVQFGDQEHIQDQSKPCTIKNMDQLHIIANNIGIEEDQMKKVLIFQKRKFLKQFAIIPYNKDKCYANRNTLSKALYDTIFDFIIHKIQISLRPQKNKQYKSISILDIFGFQNFIDNSLEQLCINFTNQKLLKLYNEYVFQREMELLKEDGLAQAIKQIIPPTNDDIISIMNGKMSIFSIVNDYTMPVQFKDQDMVNLFKGKLKNQKLLQFDKHDQLKFLVKHSQAEVMYSANGFKAKNQDKVISEIEDIVNNLFEHDKKDNFGKTLLNKFSKDIDNLMTQLESSRVHFIRCIKPNEKKIPNCPQENYILSQVRYLGVFQTIQIRKKTFPSRKTYKEFFDMYKMLIPGMKEKDPKKGTTQILKKYTTGTKSYLLGNMRVYVNDDVQTLLNKQLYILMKVKEDMAKKIQRKFRSYRYKKHVLANLKILALRVKIWKKISQKNNLALKKQCHNEIKAVADEKRRLYLLEQMRLQQEKNMKNAQYQKKKLQEQRKKEEQERKLKQKQLQELKLKRNQKLKSVVPIIYKIQLAYAFNKIKQRAHILDQTIIIETSSYNSITNHEKKQQKEKSVDQQQTSFHMSQSFMNQTSFYIQNKGVDSIFKRTLHAGFFNKQTITSPEFHKLKLILAQKYTLDITQNEQDFFSPNSQDCNFKVQECDQDILKSIITFSTTTFLKQVLRKRTNFIGIKKSEEEILIAKPRPLSKCLTHLNQSDQQEALKIFKILVKIGEQNKLQIVFKQIQSMIELCKKTSQELKNQVFLMLIKQSNTPSQLASIRIFQCLAVFLHIYSPDKDFLYAAMNLFFQKLAQQKITQKEQEYVRYLFKKMLRIIHRPFTINYMPIKYQLMALMCKRQISIPVYLPVGNSILIRVQSYHTFADIKVQVMKQFGINYKRLNPQYFTFFQIINFQNEQLGQSPIDQNQVVWDVMTYWQKAKQKFKQSQIVPPAYFLMLKIRYAYECFSQDLQSTELMFAQCYFDYFIGRIRLGVQQMAVLAACIKKIKLSHKPMDDIMGAYPVWLIKDNSKELLTKYMVQNVKLIEQEHLSDSDIKFKFLMVAQQCPLALALAIPTQQPIKLFLKPKMIYLTQKCNTLQEYSIRSVIKWAIDKQKFIFDVKLKDGKSRSHAVFTHHAHICSSYLSLIPKLIQNNNSNGYQSKMLNGI